MPAIRKIRIVNFRYNDGTRMIPDEVFCTENSDAKPVDTLLELENGGGKTVLVQLLLQPVCPRAKVQNRNISDYFQRGTDHAFVLLEWSLEKSPNSLLTGIAIAAGTNADDEAQSRNVRFYTFLRDYPPTGDKLGLDLVNFPLTERSGNHFHVKSFEDVRKYLQGKNAEYFHSDSLRQYQKRLEEYGILHTEWENILTRVNSVEGGISKFFEEYKTSDSLLDRFIIPEVMPDDKAASEELEDMFLNYAKSYSGQEKNLKLKTQITSFVKELEGMIPLIKDMWSAEDLRLQKLHCLSDTIITLRRNIDDNNGKLLQAEENIRIQEGKIRHIKAERESEKFYRKHDEYDIIVEQLAEAEKQKETAQSESDYYEHMKNVLKAAEVYKKLSEIRNRKKALIAQLHELEHGDYDAHIQALRYSLLLAAEEMQSSDEKERQGRDNALRQLDDELAALKSSLSDLKRNCDEQTSACDKAEGRKSILKEQIDEGLEKLNVHISPMLDGTYNADEKANASAMLNKNAADAENKLTESLNEDIRLDKKAEERHQRKNELCESKVKTDLQKQALLSELSEYKTAYENVMPVIKHLSMPEESVFTDEPLRCLDNEAASLKDKLNKAKRSSEMLLEQIKCMEAGQLHLPESAVSFLRESGVPFQTGENYLLNLQETMRQAILEENPLVAYSVITDNAKEQKRLLSLTENAEWLPSVVPVYTLSEIADMADKKWNRQKAFLYAYNSEYFSDVSAYEGDVRAKYDNVQTEAAQIEGLLEEWSKERKLLTDFNYAADYEKKLTNDINSCEKKLSEIIADASGIDNELEDIRTRRNELRGIKENLQYKLNDAKKRIKDFDEICGIILRYESLYSEITQYEADISRLKSRIEQTDSAIKQKEQLINEYRIKANILNERLNEYRNTIDELRDSPRTELIAGTYEELSAEYNEYKANCSSNIKELRNRIAESETDDEKAEERLKKSKIAAEEYTNAEYSDEAYENADENRKAAEKKLTEANNRIAELSRRQGKLETALEQVEETLRTLNMKLLERSETGSEHERRLKECEERLDGAKAEHSKYEGKLKKLNDDKEYAEEYASRYCKEVTDYSPKPLESVLDIKALIAEIGECDDNLTKAERTAEDYHSREIEQFRNENNLFIGTIDGIKTVIRNKQSSGDKYFTLWERTEQDIGNYRDRANQLDILLKDVEDSKKQLVGHCLQRTGRLYENIKHFSDKSKVQIGNARKQMINISLPEVDSTGEIARERIEQYITTQVKRYLSDRDESKSSRKEHLEIRRLLNCYIGQESIPIAVYKIDKNPLNNRYRSWEDALKANSGGEQFVVLFSLVVSAMNYVRSMSERLGDTSGVLILDNPFGSTSSGHLLEPMFRIAHHFNIQLICLTHLGTAEITGCFEMVYQLRLKKLALSNMAVLESKPMQEMEHAFYLSEQLSF